MGCRPFKQPRNLLLSRDYVTGNGFDVSVLCIQCLGNIIMCLLCRRRCQWHIHKIVSTSSVDRVWTLLIMSVSKCSAFLLYFIPWFNIESSRKREMCEHNIRTSEFQNIVFFWLNEIDARLDEEDEMNITRGRWEIRTILIKIVWWSPYLCMLLKHSIYGFHLVYTMQTRDVS